MNNFRLSECRKKSDIALGLLYLGHELLQKTRAIFLRTKQPANEIQSRVTALLVVCLFFRLVLIGMMTQTFVMIDS